MNLFSQTEKGPREQNQDSFLLRGFDGGLCFLVADGVGGNNAGDIASQTACETFFDAISEGASPVEAINISHLTIRDLATENPELAGMATTLTCAILHENRVYGIHTGDSRAYLLRNNGIKQITQDHSEVERLVLAGKLTRQEAATYPRKNVLYSAIGVSGALTYQEFNFDLEEGDRVLLMTDGVYSVVTKKEFRDVSLEHFDFDTYCKKIIEKVVNGHTKDNYTLIGFQYQSSNGQHS